MGLETRFRQRLRELVVERFGSLDRFYLETGFSKGHVSQIIRGDRSPSLATVERLAAALEVDPIELFQVPKRGGSRESQ